MQRFLDHDFDVLVTTAIIESGLDMPRVNTIIIDRADRFGLAQLYQLRGRVGRSAQRAFAYLMTPPGERLTPEARRRLAALEEFQALGSGYHIAMRDLEIRGAGNLLGEEQHGHMEAIGFDLYCRLLEETVAELRRGRRRCTARREGRSEGGGLPARRVRWRPPAEDGSVPAACASARARRTWKRLREEFVDRYGPLPEPVANLLAVHRIRVLAGRNGVNEVRAVRQGVRPVFRWRPGTDAAYNSRLVGCRPPGSAVQGRRSVQCPSADRQRATAVGGRSYPEEAGGPAPPYPVSRGDVMMAYRPTFFRVLTLAALLAALAGCGKTPVSDDSVVAKIGDRTITAQYYKQMLGKMKPESLPRGENGEPVDTATLDGKQAFLDVLINKELMVAKAIQQGYDKDTQVQMALGHLLDYHAMIYFWEDVIGEPAKTVSEEELQYYYSRLGEKRSCDFLIADFESDAIKARDAARAGTPWAKVSADYHAQSADPNRPTSLVVPWGQFADEFEREIFAVPEGGITEPIPTQYGYWVVKVNQITQEPKPELDAIRVRVLDSIRKRKINLAQEDLKLQVREKHNFVINEDALLVVFNGLPAQEHIIDPATGKPTPREQLLPLVVPSEHLDEVLFSYNLSTGPIVFSVGDYKARFDEMNVFDRAKKVELLGNLRTKIEDEAEKIILLDEARTRGFMEDPRTVTAAHRQLEEMLVERVHEDQVAAEQYVAPEELNAFWQEHAADYAVPEVRNGHIVVCKDRATAEQARDALVKRADEPNIWKQVNKLYGSIPKLEREFGRLHQVRADAKDVPGKDLFFSLPLNELSQATQIPEGWAVIKCEGITPANQPKLEEVSEAVGQRIRATRKDTALSAKLAEWRTEFKVDVNSKILAAMPSLAELTKPAEDLKPVVEKTLDGDA